MRASLIIVSVAALCGCAETREVRRPSPGGDRGGVKLDGCEGVEATPQGSSSFSRSRLGRLWGKVHPGTVKAEEEEIAGREGGQPGVRTQYAVSSGSAPMLHVDRDAGGQRGGERSPEEALPRDEDEPASELVSRTPRDEAEG